MSSQPVSPAPTDATNYWNIDTESSARLSRYRAASQDEQTYTILKAFTEFLPRDGARNIMNDILDLGEDRELGSLANRLRTAILAPSK